MSTNETQNFTKLVEVVPLEEKTLDDLVGKERIAEIERQVGVMNNQLDCLVEAFTKLNEENHGWIQMENKDVFYQTEVSGIFPNFETFDFGCTYEGGYSQYDKHVENFSGYRGRLIKEHEFELLETQTTIFNKFLYNIRSFLLNNDSPERGYEGILLEGTNYLARRFADIKNPLNETFVKRVKGDNYGVMCFEIPVYRLKQQTTIASHILQLMEENLIPKGLKESDVKTLQTLKILWNKKRNSVMSDNIIYIDKNCILNQSEITTLTGKSFDFAEMKREYTKTLPISNPDIEKKLRKTFDETLLNVDQIRADLDPYQEKILTDPNGGHWDLWEQEPITDDGLSLKLTTPLVARDPMADVWEDGIIGIDFGTKSTVVVFQEDSEQTLPLRVGTGQLSEEIDSRHYENPTVLEFVDLNSFLSAYREKDGRPNTKWEQVTTSHTAFYSFLNSTSDQYYSYLYELKQWAGDKQRKIHLRDKQGVDVVLDPYQQLNQDDFDPIEIYAYYLGLYINNMHNGIYLDYLLSYPVAYEKSVRDRLIDSFTRGIKKSLPESILNNEELMKKFRVSLGASEPVCYAICALEECGFQPEGDDEIFYGVFDFGGGTSDFDFGLYREAKSRRFDFEVESFGSKGDQYLGGENLLELLSFEVFKANQSTLRSKNITFERPTECKRFAGDEILIDESQEAKLNMAQLKEKLRPLWERHEGYETEFENGKIKVSLFNSKGENLPNIELEANLEALELILRNRIEKGVKNFFESLVIAFNLPNNTSNVDKINILKAGNSSKSAILSEVMDEYIEMYNGIINQGEGENRFVVFPPLGTDEADEFMRNHNLPVKPRTVEQPTCKTGVAFGLISSQQGGRINLIRETKTTEEVKFPFFLGYEKRQKFCALQKETMEYGQWVEFIDAEEVDFKIYFSKLPTVLLGDTSVEDVKRKRCRLLNVEPNANVYIRPSTPTSIEYVVATEEGIAQKNYLSDIVTEVLES